MKPLPTLLTVALIGVTVSVLIVLYQMLVLPLQSLGIFLIALGLGVAVLAKRFDRLVSLQRGAFSLTRSPLVLSIVLVMAGVGILLFGMLSLLVIGLFLWWQLSGRKRWGLEKLTRLHGSTELSLRRRLSSDNR